MTISLDDFAASNTDYVQRLNNNNTVLEEAINSLQAAVLASSGEGAALILDMFDRDGIVGAQSYVLDIENYPGAALIDIGRRPIFDPVQGETDVSVAWATFAGNKFRVTQTGDVQMNAGGIITGLPKTIYVGVPSSGTAQIYEDQTDPNVLYIYSMTWDGFSLTDFKRIAHLLPSHETIQRIAATPSALQVFDSDTDWTEDVESSTSICTLGAADDNEIFVDGAIEVLGFFININKPGDDGFNAFPGADQADIMLDLVVMSNGLRWNLEDLELDCSSVPDTIFAAVDIANVGDDRFVTTTQTFTLERDAIGSAVTSARAFTWGVIYRPIHGIAIAKDSTEVETI